MSDTIFEILSNLKWSTVAEIDELLQVWVEGLGNVFIINPFYTFAIWLFFFTFSSPWWRAQPFALEICECIKTSQLCLHLNDLEFGPTNQNIVLLTWLL